MANDPSAYQHALGKSFNDLPAALREFAGTGQATYAGTCTVTRGSTAWSRFVGLFMGLPRKVSNADFVLDVDHAPHRCVWIRRFPKKKTLKTVIRSAGQPGAAVMAETVGAANLTFKLGIEDGRLVMTSQKGRFLGIPLPGFMAPNTVASIGCHEDMILVESTVTMGRRSRLMRYSFEVKRRTAAETAAARSAGATDKKTKAPAESPSRKTESADRSPRLSPMSQEAPRPADSGARTVPISAAEERQLRSDLKASTEGSDIAAEVTDGAWPAAEDDATAVLGRPETVPDMKPEADSQVEPRPLDANKPTVPVSASKVRKIPRRNAGKKKD